MKNDAFGLLSRHPLALGLLAIGALVAVALASPRIAPARATWAARLLAVVWFVVLVVVTLTSAGDVAMHHPRELNLVPGRTLIDALHRSDGHQRVQSLGNIVMFAPLGVLGTLAAALTVRGVAVVALATSLCVEVAQYVLATGRIADINDVVLNVAGAVAGAAVFRLLRRRLAP